MDNPEVSRELLEEAQRLESSVANILADAKKLRDAAAVLAATNGVHVDAAQPKAGKGKGKNASNNVIPETGRLREIHDFLVAKGPLFRREVIAQSGMPKGTLSALLTEKYFVKETDGRWSAKQ